MPSGSKRVFFKEHAFSVDENVYEPAEDSFLFAENLVVKEGERVLDMGTGSGILGIIAAEKACEVVAVDVNPYGVRCAKANAVVNNARSKMVFIMGDLFNPFDTSARFSLILFNAPYLPIDNEKDNSLAAIAWNGGKTGRDLIDRFIGEVFGYLSPNGRVLLMQSNLAGLDATLERFASFGMSVRVLAQHRLPFFETLFLLEARLEK
jgi:release factor glutamine methyltransferase